jgi:hypothetical protein
MSTRYAPFVLALLVALLPADRTAADGEVTYEGFGGATVGGAGGKVVHVTSLEDSGPGSLRQALWEGDRTIVFDVAGEIVLTSHLYMKGSFVTIDGFTAPPPGITISGKGLVIRGISDVIVRGLRFRASAGDAITVNDGASNVVISHVSTHGAADGNIDITLDTHDVTVAWSILAEPASGKAMLIKYNAAGVTLHHNLFVMSKSRSPAAAVDDLGTPATTTTLDMRNNVVWGWTGGSGTMIHHGAAANVVDNYYTSPWSRGSERKKGLIVCKNGSCFYGDPASDARAFVAGNVSGEGFTDYFNAQGTEVEPFPAPPVATTDACTAARQVLEQAGVRPLDDLDASYLGLIAPPTC